MEIKVKLPAFLEIGFISYEELETGIWKLETPTHSYNLSKLPVEFQKQGIKVAIVLNKLEDEMDIFMNGDFYEVLLVKEIK